MHLPISEEDLGEGTDYGLDEDRIDYGGGFSFVKLFFTILFAAPLATALALGVTDYYHEIMGNEAELKVPVTAKVTAPAHAVAPQKTSGISSAEFGKMVKAIEKSNRLIASAIEKQSKSAKKEMETLAKIAKQKPTVVKVVSQVGGKAKMPSIVVVRVPSKGKFDLDYELERILQLSEVDLDDPNISPEDFDQITSKPVLKEIIRALEYLIASAPTHPEIGDVLKKHAIKAKKYARARLGKLQR